jgi:hypothetical protein
VTGTFTTTVPAGGVTLISAVPASGTGGTGELVSGQSGQCLDTRGNGTPGPYVFFPGTAEQIWPCNAGSTRSSPPRRLVSCGPWAPPNAWTSATTRPLITVHPTPGISDSAHHVYRTDEATHLGSPADAYESERIAWVPLAGIPALIGRGEIVSATTTAALLYLLSTG